MVIAALVALGLLAPATSLALEPLGQVGAGGVGGAAGQVSPLAVAIGSNGDVYVTESSNRRVSEFHPDGEFVRAWGDDVTPGGGTGFEVCTTATGCQAGTAGGGAGEFVFPEGIAVNAAGNLYVADSGTERIDEFSLDGDFIRAWGYDVTPGGGTGFEVCTTATGCKTGAPGEAAGQLFGPIRIAVSPQGSVFVGEIDNDRISEFSAAGEFIRAWGYDVNPAGGTGFEVCTSATGCKSGLAGTAAGQFNGPEGIAVGPGERVLVSDNVRINEYGPGGEFIRALGTDVVPGGSTALEVCTTATTCKVGVSGSGAGQMSLASFGLAASAAGDVYVTDTESHRIDQFAGTEFVGAWGFNVIPGGSTGFETCTIATTCQAGTFGKELGQLSSPSGIAIDCRGGIWVSDFGRDLVIRYGEPGTALPPCPPPHAVNRPSNSFRFGKLKRNKRRGTATLAVIVPGPGELILNGKRVKKARKVAGGAGTVKLPVRPIGKGKAKLSRVGRLRLRLKVTYTPTGGDPSTRAKKVVLRRALE